METHFQELREQGIGETAAAILVLADAVRSTSVAKNMDELSHAICMGIRMGMFGVEAQADADIRDLDGYRTAEAIEEVAAAIDRLELD